MNSAAALTLSGWRGVERSGIAPAYFTWGLISGGVLSASVVAVLAWAAPARNPVWSVPVAGLLVLVALLRDLGAIRFNLPQAKRQVSESLMESATRRAASFQFGFEMGTGVRTYLTTSSPYALVALILLLRPPIALVIACGVAFGVGRAGLIWVRALMPVDAGSVAVRFRPSFQVASAIALVPLAVLVVGTYPGW